jgi:biotin carboxyl carrier protein
LAASAGLGAYFTQTHWLPWLQPALPVEASAEAAPPMVVGEQILLSAQAQKNLRMVAKPLTVQTFWQTLPVPGMIVDRPGHSDRSIVAPLTGIVSRVHRVPGQLVRPGDVLFTLKLLSESIQLTQTDLFKATQDIALAQAQKQRLLASGGAVPEARIIEVDNQITRQQVAATAYRQELLNRGLSAEQIDAVAAGKFVREIALLAPARSADALVEPLAEVQELKVELGQQVQAGQTLCLLANHQALAIEGRAFRDETPLLERAVKAGWPVTVDFGTAPDQDWPARAQAFEIEYIANTIDPDTRTFRFLLPLENQARVIEKSGRTQILWQYRPGQRVRLHVRVAALDNVFVLPPAAVVREGANTYVFRQNLDTFDRKPVQVVHEERHHVVLANDGSVPAGIYVAQTGAAQLNRMLKAQSNALPKGFHIHADGSVHYGSHD